MSSARGINITDVLVEYYSEYKWAVHGETYSGLVWHSDESHKPTESDINEKIMVNLLLYAMLCWLSACWNI